MKTQSLLSGKNRTVMLSLIAGLSFSFNGYSQDGTLKDCACVKKIQNGPVITFLNVTEYAEDHDSYVMLTDCEDGENCEGQCTWAVNEGVHGWKLENGECMEWPVKQPVDGEKSNYHTPSGAVNDQFREFQFYPNPASGKINIKTTAENVTTVIYDLTGAEIMRSREKTVDISRLSSGTYVICITDGIFLQREQLIIE